MMRQRRAPKTTPAVPHGDSKAHPLPLTPTLSPSDGEREGAPPSAGVHQRCAVFLILVFAALLPLAGCGKSDSGLAVTEMNLGPDGVDVAAVQKAFEAASPNMRFALDEAFRIIKAGAYRDALPALGKVAENPKATPEQKQALEGLIQKLKTLPASGAAP